MAADAYQYPRLQAVDPLVGYVSRLDTPALMLLPTCLTRLPM
jgi:hypothetical protein